MSLRALFRNLWERIRQQPNTVEEPVNVLRDGLRIAARRAATKNTPRLRYPVKLPDLMPGVVPKTEKSGIAMDSNFEGNLSNYQGFAGHLEGFMGYPRLAMLALRAEYRAMASALSTELTREWITIGSSETAGDSTKERITKLTKKIEDICLRDTIQLAAEQDAYFGRAQIAIKIKGKPDSDELPLVLDKRSIAIDSFQRVVNVEAIWTTPAAYNANDPLAPDFYKPPMWYVLGRKVNASRLLTVITRQVPDMLKPAFNFGGMALTQLSEPYVDNWLRTRQAVSNLIDKFSTTALATNMGQALTSEEGDGEDLFNRVELFTAMRSNQGVAIIDKETEEFVQFNVPLSGLDKLQAQAQEHMCAVSRIPAIVLTGISPAGLNASSEGEIRAFYDWIAAQQEAYWRQPIDTILKVLMLSMFGEINEDIHFSFNPLYQMTEKELSEIRKTDAEAAGVYIDRGVIAPEEERERIARNTESGYSGLDLDIEIDNPNLEEDEDEEEILLFLPLLSVALYAQVNIKGAAVDATQGYTVNGAAPSNQVLCGNGSRAVMASACGIAAASATTAATATNANAIGGVALSGLCQTGGTGCPSSSITGSTGSSGYIIFPTGLIIQWMQGPSVTEAGDSLHSGSWPIPFPHAIFGATCSTTTGQGGSGTPGDTDIHAMQMSASSTSGWTVRHSVGGVYSQAQTVSCFLTAVGN